MEANKQAYMWCDGTKFIYIQNKLLVIFFSFSAYFIFLPSGFSSNFPYFIMVKYIHQSYHNKDIQSDNIDLERKKQFIYS